MVEKSTRVEGEVKLEKDGVGTNSRSGKIGTRARVDASAYITVLEALVRARTRRGGNLKGSKVFNLK